MQHGAAGHQLLLASENQTQQQQQQQQQPTTTIITTTTTTATTTTAILTYTSSAANQPQSQSLSGHFTSVDLIFASILVGLILISIIGNCLVCVAIFTDRRLRKLGNAFIVSLAIADLFVSCLVMTFALCNDLMSHWIFGEYFCDVWISFDIMCCTASILNLCAISLDRFVHIKDCLLYNQWMTRKVALSGVMIIWFISALVSFVPINLGWHKPDHFGGSAFHSSPDGYLKEPIPALGGSALAELANSNNFQGGKAALKVQPGAELDLDELSGLSGLTGLAGQRQEQGQSEAGPKLNYNSRRSIWPANGRLEIAADGELAKNENQNQNQNQNQTRSAADLPNAIKLSFLSEMPDIGGRLDPALNDYSATGRQQRKQTRSSGPLTIAVGPNNKLVAPQRPAEFNWQPHVGDSDLGVADSSHPSPLNGGLPGQRQVDQNQLKQSEQQQQQQPALRQQASGELPQCMLSLTPTYAIISSTISFYIPCIIMLGLYTKLWACARRHVRNIQAISMAPAPIALSGPAGSLSLLGSTSAVGSPEPPSANLNTSAALIKPASKQSTRVPFPKWTPPLRTLLKFKRLDKKKKKRNLDDDDDHHHDNQTTCKSIVGSAARGGADGSGVAAAAISQPNNNNNCSSCCSRTSEQSDTLTSTTMDNDNLASCRNNINRPICRQSNNNNATACRRCQSSLSTRQLLATISGSGEPPADEKDLISAQKFIQSNHDHDTDDADPDPDETVAIEPLKSSSEQANLSELAPRSQLKLLLQNQEASDNQTGTLNKTEAPPTNDEHHPFLSELSDNNNNSSSFSGIVNLQANTCSQTGDNGSGSLRAVKINFAPTQYQQQQQQQQQQQSGQLATHKAAITLGIIMGTFLCCWVPFFCLNIIKAFCVDCIPGWIFRLFTWLGYANSALNPIIYGIHNSEFRNAFNRIFFKHLNIKNSRYYMNRRSSYDLRHANHRLHSHQRGRFRKSFDQQADSK